MRVGQIFVILALASMLGGCVAAYKPPPSGPTATFQVRFVHPISGLVGVRAYNNPKCEKTMDLYNARLERDGPESKPVAIAADRPFTVRMASGHDNSVCAISVVFDPKEGAHYVAEYDSVGTQCYIRVMRTESGSSTDPVLEKSARKNWPQCSGVSGTM